ncbi:MAG: aminomethyltransferase family protein, partial [Candidatus Puniceispirillales bacterium]
EQALWYAPDGVSDVFSWRRSTDFEHVGAEVKAVREGVGLTETSGFAKYEITGEGAAEWLDRLLACQIPAIGRMTLAPMLKENGKVIGDFTLARLAEDRFLIIGSGIAENYHLRWFNSYLPQDGSVNITSCGLGLTGLSIAGLRAREVLAAITDDDVSNDHFRFMDIRETHLGMVPVIIGRVSYTGDLGYEIWVAAEYQRRLFDDIMAAGQNHDIRLFGSRALNALRLEKNFGSWAREYRPVYGPMECGLSRFVAYDKDADFIGKAAACAEKQDGGKMRLRAFIVDVKDADVIGDEPIAYQGDVVGWVTSGGFAHASGKSVAMGYVPKEMADHPDGWSVELLGEILPACLQATPLFDANGSRMRS